LRGLSKAWKKSDGFFQGLEKVGLGFSNGWKIRPARFQCLENAE
jgi:hypothetical protein